MHGFFFFLFFGFFNLQSFVFFDLCCSIAHRRGEVGNRKAVRQHSYTLVYSVSDLLEPTLQYST